MRNQTWPLWIDEPRITPGPDLTDYDIILVNSSAGNDSQATLDVVVETARSVGVLNRVVVVHADLGESEWPGARELAAEHAHHYGMRFEVVARRTTNGTVDTILDRVAQRGMWPDARRRWCTSVLSSDGLTVSSVSYVDCQGLFATLETSLDWVSLSCRVAGGFSWGFYVLSMRAQRVISPSTGRVSWTVVGADLMPVAPVERFLAYLAATERSPLTARTYAHDLAVFFRFLAERGLVWDAVSLDDLAQYIFWLRKPAPEVIVLDLDSAGRAPNTVNRMLSAVSAFYGHHARAGVAVADQLTTWRRIARRDYKPFLHHITKGRPVQTSALRLRTTRRLPRTLTAEQVQTLLDV